MTVLESTWIMPLFAAVFIVAMFVSVFAQLFPAPYYLGLVMPYVLCANVLVLLFQLIRKRDKFLLTTLFSLPAFGLGYLWSIQTA